MSKNDEAKAIPEATEIEKRRIDETIGQQPGTNMLDLLKLTLEKPKETGELIREVSSALKGTPEQRVTETRQVTYVTIAIMLILSAVVATSAP